MPHDKFHRAPEPRSPLLTALVYAVSIVATGFIMSRGLGKGMEALGEGLEAHGKALGKGMEALGKGIHRGLKEHKPLWPPRRKTPRAA